MNILVKQSPRLVSLKRTNEIKSKLFNERNGHSVWVIKPKHANEFYSYFDSKKEKRGVMAFQERKMANYVRTFINQTVEICNSRSKYNRPYPPLEIKKINSDYIYKFCAVANLDFIYFYLNNKDMYEDIMIAHFHLLHE